MNARVYNLSARKFCFVKKNRFLLTVCLLNRQKDSAMISENIIERTLSEQIKKMNSYFVFATQTAADLWADRIIETSDVHAVATERFLAWDTFKGESIRSQQQEKKAVPSAMRSIFTAQLIEENAASPFLKNCIAPEYAQTASGFSQWITGFLPSLALWKKYFDMSGGEADDEDKDLLVIYKKYRAFLEKHRLFDPAWETPPFKADERHYFLFFPEIFSDYIEYKKILEDAKETITIIHLPEKNEETIPPVDFFTDARTEIRSIALHLRALHEKKHLNWQSIAVHIPDMESYGPYLDRELELFQIPHVIRSAKPLSQTGAGFFFTQAKNCVSNDFSFDSVKTLLLNTALPWKDGQAVRQLISFGMQNNCICSFTYDGRKIDVWKESFKRSSGEEIAFRFYKALHEKLTKLTEAKTFSEIRAHYFDFRDSFFDMENCPEQSDRIISRCISELSALIDLEQEFPDCRVPDCFSFFIQYLETKPYLAQTEERGVHILPYKMGACAPFSCHIIADASQSAVSVVYKELSFLRDDKRRHILNRDDTNVTEEFLRLYAMNSFSEPLYCTASAKTFTGYAQASSYLLENDRTKETEETLHADDCYYAEKKWLAKGTLSPSCFPKNITAFQKQSIRAWENCISESESSNEQAEKSLFLEKIHEMSCKTEHKIQISATRLNTFYTCPRLWLQTYISKIKPHINEADLMNPFAKGNLYHKILELYCTALKQQNLPLHTENDALPHRYKQILLQTIADAIETEQNSFLAKELLRTAENALTAEIEETIISFSQTFEGSSVYAVEQPYTYTVPEKNLIFYGKIDCLLYDTSAADFILIDFKTSSAPENKYYGNPLETEIPADSPLPDFQLPMYLYLLENQNPPIQIRKCGFFLIKPHTYEPVIVEMPSKKEPVTSTLFRPTVQKFIECAKQFAQKIEAADFSVSSTEQDFDTCNSCDFRAVCRRVFNISRQD